MKLLIGMILSLTTFAANAYELQFAVEDQVQLLEANYEDIIDFQPIQDFELRKAKMLLVHTNDANPAQDIAIVKKTKDGLVELEAVIEGQTIVFTTLDKKTDYCGSVNIKAASRNTFEKIEMTLKDHTNRTCKDLRDFKWEANIQTQTEIGATDYILGGNPE